MLKSHKLTRSMIFFIFFTCLKMNSFLLQIVMHTTAESIPAFQNAVSQFHLWWIIMIVQERDFILIVFEHSPFCCKNGYVWFFSPPGLIQWQQSLLSTSLPSFLRQCMWYQTGHSSNVALCPQQLYRIFGMGSPGIHLDFHTTPELLRLPQENTRFNWVNGWLLL